jgi:hypothetical protein
VSTINVVITGSKINIMKFQFLKKIFKRKYPYGPVAYLGRKTVERSLGADIVKLKKLDEVEAIAQNEEQTKQKRA